jgi:hypothetical protein
MSNRPPRRRGTADGRRRLEARGIDPNEGRLTSESEGDFEVEDGVLIIKRIRVHSIGACIAITTSLSFV